MSINFYCYTCKEAFTQVKDQKCPQCGDKVFGKTERNKGMISVLFSVFFLFLAMPAYKMDKTFFYICLVSFFVFFWLGIRKVQGSQ